MSGAAKPGGKAYRTELRKRLALLGFDDERATEQIVSDLIGPCCMRPRKAWRLARELSLQMAAERFNIVVGDARAPMRKARIWDYEQWPASGVRPTIRTLKVLARVYGTTWQQLIDLDDLGAMPDRDRNIYHETSRIAAARELDHAQTRSLVLTATIVPFGSALSSDNNTSAPSALSPQPSAEAVTSVIAR